ncbi:MAG: hypothetical protein JNL21_31965 [Myxococcales bacterium]|nr:hypothetical protein [Myxococcales bacterium]
MVAIAPGEVGVSLGINAQGELLVWGNEINPWEAGDGKGRGPGPEQHLVLPVRDAVSVSMESHGVAIDRHGSLFYWGGLEIDVPTLYPAPGRVVTGEANHNVVCYLLDSAEVYCFGGNKFGQLGQADLSLLSYDSFIIDLPLPAQKVDAGDQRACALLVNGEVWCWGNGGDILGVSWEELPYSPVPLHVPELPVAKDLFVEGGGACILDTSDLAHCWGTAYPIRLRGLRRGAPTRAPAVRRGGIPVSGRRVIHWGGLRRLLIRTSPGLPRTPDPPPARRGPPSSPRRPRASLRSFRR